jgi:hypothetical protein
MSPGANLDAEARSKILCPYTGVKLLPSSQKLWFLLSKHIAVLIVYVSSTVIDW